MQSKNIKALLKNILVIGQGKIGLPVTNILAEQGKLVTGLARGRQDKYSLHSKANFIQANALDLMAEDLQPFTHIIVIVTPDQYNADNYQNTYLAIAKHLASLAHQLQYLQHLVFISSTSVYGQNDGQWIDENTIPQLPHKKSSQYILQAEQALQLAFGNKTVIIRPSGIYGEKRLMQIANAKQDKKPLTTPKWTNRIMDTDLINIIVQILNLDKPKPIYLATDYCPVTILELMQWICLKLQFEPPTMSSDYPTVPAIGKRLHSNIPLEWLNYPDWQIGYKKILQSLMS